MLSKQMRIRPHNDDPALLVVEIYEYTGSIDAPLGEPLEDECCQVEDLPDAVIRAVSTLLQS